MNQKPVLVVMAAGMGSRYGGLKQVDPVGKHGQLIIDYSLYDARRAGFETVVFVIKRAIEKTFKEAIGNRLEKVMNVKYAYQELSNLPQGFSVPQGREKPWGTCHAILSAKPFLDGPFAVINSDDYYGAHAFSVIYNYLNTHSAKDNVDSYCMVGYDLQNTVTENGHVARGVCVSDSQGNLKSVTEHTHIEKQGNEIRYTDDNGQSWGTFPGSTTVSMNLWGFSGHFLEEAENRFPTFLKANLLHDPLKCEYFLPSVVSQLIEEKKAIVKVLHSPDKWYGVTYKADKPTVVNAVAQMTESGLYPENLWNSSI